MLGAHVRGTAVLAGETVDLTGWSAYAEKNWGGEFPGEWWWGQAGLGDGAMAAFAGGRLGGPLAATAIAVRAGDSVLRFVPVVAERRAILRSEHHLAGRLRVVARRGRRVILREESQLAGLEYGTPDATDVLNGGH
jgi:hypothetical protein